MNKEEKKESLDSTLDWEYMSDFYESDTTNKVKSLEEYTLDDEEPVSDNLEEINSEHTMLLKTIEDVKKVRELMGTGKNVKEMAEHLNLDEAYIQNIAITLCSSTEDSGDIAIAQLVLLG